MSRIKTNQLILKTITTESKNGAISIDLKIVAKAIEVSIYNYTIQYTDGSPESDFFKKRYIANHLKQIFEV